jgi:hypothetical protein
VRGVLGRRGDRDDRVAHVAHPIRAQGVLVLGHRQDAEGLGHRFAGEEAQHPGHLSSLRQVAAADARVRPRRAHQLHVRHARKDQVVGEERSAGHFGPAVDASEGLANIAVAALGRRRRWRIG